MAIDLSEEQLKKVGTTAKTIKEAIKPEPESFGDKVLDFFGKLPESISNVKKILEDAKDIRNPPQQKPTYERPTKPDELQGFDAGKNPIASPQQIIDLNLEVRVDNILANIFNEAEKQGTTLKAMSGYQFLQFLKLNKEKLKLEMLNELRK